MSKKTETSNYLKKIKFKKVFCAVEYIGDSIYQKRREILYSELGDYHEGIIIGQTIRKEGISYFKSNYIPSYFEDDDGDSSGSFKMSKIVPFWIVSLGFNNTVLVPKDSVIL